MDFLGSFQAHKWSKFGDCKGINCDAARYDLKKKKKDLTAHVWYSTPE